MLSIVKCSPYRANNQLKTDNQRLVVLCLVMFSVYGGLLEFCFIVGSRLARALGVRRAF
ncbi:hypothetical protein [Vibrio sp. SCSIO 43145]|uniref:hypothetical protein n=1 Tax=Vibrio sp. SCSIO 43145 TaxID=2819097 RepID=UPI0020755282|nr:hypothetical protein [Vibrio sp. SCSIO 43145]USD46738.1 hypothetical protein J4N38_06265 [Vibrio sp. SCSIO 43145]